MITGTAGGGLCRWVPRETRLSYRIAHLTPGLPSIANPAIRYRGTSKYRATKKSTCFQLVRLAESGKGKKNVKFSGTPDQRTILRFSRARRNRDDNKRADSVEDFAAVPS